MRIEVNPVLTFLDFTAARVGERKPQLRTPPDQPKPPTLKSSSGTEIVFFLPLTYPVGRGGFGFA